MLQNTLECKARKRKRSDNDGSTNFKHKTKMTRILIILISTFGLTSLANADTIDFWLVYYNNVKIQEFNQYSKGEIVLKIKDIKKTDSLTVKYFRDTPCEDCETQVAIENGKHFVITKGKGVGTLNPIKISVYALLQYHLKADKEVYEVFYNERQITSRTQRALIFRIKLE